MGGWVGGRGCLRVNLNEATESVVPTSKQCAIWLYLA